MMERIRNWVWLNLRDSDGRKQYLLIAATAIISFLILGGLIYRERDVFYSYNWELRWHYILYALSLFSSIIVLAALLWADIMRVLGSKIEIRQHIRIYGISHIAKRLPGTVWYVASRSYFYGLFGEPLRRMAIGSGIEFILVFLAGALVSVMAVTTTVVKTSQQNAFILAGSLLLGLLLIHPLCLKWFMVKVKVDAPPRLQYLDIVRWLLGYVLLYLLGGVVFYFIGNAVTPIRMKHLPYIIGIWSLVATLSVMVFFLPSNFGFTEVGLSLLLSTVVSSSLAVLIAIIARFLMIVYELITVGVIVLLIRDDSAQPQQCATKKL